MTQILDSTTHPHFKHLGNTEPLKYNIEIDEHFLKKGSYLLDVSDYNGLKNPCFKVPNKMKRTPLMKKSLIGLLFLSLPYYLQVRIDI